MTDSKFLSHPIPIKPPTGKVRWRRSGTCDECGSCVEFYCLEDGTLGRHGCQCCEFVTFCTEIPLGLEQIERMFFMLEPDITPDDFNELTNSIEHDNWLNGVEINHDGEFMSTDTPYTMGFEVTLSTRWRLHYDHHIKQIPQARRLVADVRLVRDWGCTPFISIEDGGLEYLSDFWPRFMFSRTEKKVEKGLIAWVKRLVRIEMKDTITTVLPNSIHTEYIKEQILKKQALPIDGVWVPCEVTI